MLLSSRLPHYVPHGKAACLAKKKAKDAGLLEAAPSEGTPAVAAPRLVPLADPSWDAIKSAANWEHAALYQAVTETLFLLPAYFKSDLRVTGITATDLHTFNTALGATIETQIVDALNNLREEWDPGDKYRKYQFVRQAQRFPDVILRGSTPGTETEIIMGVELKGWFALAKESEPSYRFKVTPNACAPWDLLAVYPWAFSDVVSGTPRLFRPFVTSARYAAEYRNWFWQHGMRSKGNKKINFSAVDHFYPTKSETIADQAVSDRGRNFGRVARYRIMDDYMASLARERLSGIPISAWQRFLGVFSEEQTEENIVRAIGRLVNDFAPVNPELSPDDVTRLKESLLEAVTILERARSN
jgi:hypothetical protein